MLNTIQELLQGKAITEVRHLDSDITIVLGDVRLWVSSPWRLEKDGVVVVGSGNLVEALSHEDYKDDYDDYVETIASHVSGSFDGIEFSDFNELKISLSSGFTFRTFQDYGDDAENFQLYVGQGRYLVYPNSIEAENV